MDQALTLKVSVTALLFLLIYMCLDSFLGTGLMFWPLTVVISAGIVILFSRRHKFWYDTLIYIWFLLIAMLVSFQTHATYLDPHNVFFFCLLFVYSFLFFNGWRLVFYYVFITICIMIILQLYRENVWAYRLDAKDYARYGGAVDLLSYLFLIINSIYIYNGFQKHFAAAVPEPTEEIHATERSTSLEKVLEAVTRRDNSFLSVFGETYPDFVGSLHNLNAGLTEVEIEICALIKLYFTTKEIAIATNSTYKAIEAKKYRIRKKLNLSSDTNLAVYFNSEFVRSGNGFA